ncbi:hypothetical protein [Bradyrhizobium liaoningense]|uniref:hypothetical protein n=1 Tax=Bradyrhizobium liaoningense TaxID=43992 RepID=UPI001BA81C2E|nr:hypothetical protein [Bradyrhizobium liaoningense]MBR0715708.1 hypothetical protein [Bradyrhizobium liaoningense]
MRKLTIFALAAIGMTVAAPLAAYYETSPSDDPLGDTLRQYGFQPINPPSNLMSVGSLYYVDAKVKDFKAICHADKADLEDAVVSSRSWEMQESLERKGRFATGVEVDLGWLFHDTANKSYVAKVRSSLTDVVLEEIPLGPNWAIFAKLMKKPECNEVAMQYIHAGGYVCQGQKILQATAEYKLDQDAESKLAAKTTNENIKDIVKLAVEAQADQAVVDRQGRLFAGAALKYGISMTPICLAPPTGRFQRVLPQTALGRVANFVLFNIVEPILPAQPDHVKVAQGPQEAEQPK